MPLSEYYGSPTSENIYEYHVNNGGEVCQRKNGIKSVSKRNIKAFFYVSHLLITCFVKVDIYDVLCKDYQFHSKQEEPSLKFPGIVIVIRQDVH